MELDGNYRLNFIQNDNPILSSFWGGHIMSKNSDFSQNQITLKEYEENGSSIINRLKILN